MRLNITSPILWFLFCFLGFGKVSAQMCGAPGIAGPTSATGHSNTYYPPVMGSSITSGANTVTLAAVPPNDPYGNHFGSTPISVGDLLLIIQIQDADFWQEDNPNYGSSVGNSGPDGLGGTGYLNLNSTGLCEYVIAESAVPLSGGLLTFRGNGMSDGALYDYTQADATPTTGQKRFQVVRVPQYSSLTLAANITTPPWNGQVGGIIAMQVAGDLNFNGYRIDASAKGFRGGFQYPLNSNWADTVSMTTDNTRSSTKGEGICGTPRYMWDGFNEVDYGSSWVGYPGGDFGKGAPGNAGGGGNDHNAGGGGGGNGGDGGKGGFGLGDAAPFYTGGRPGSAVLSALPRVFLGGGGGGGDANNTSTGAKGGVGGGIVFISASRLLGNVDIRANADDGDRGVFNIYPDGAGGGGGGGTIFLNVHNCGSTSINLSARGGRGGNTEQDGPSFPTAEHGPGGGGGGGVIYHTLGSCGTVICTLTGGLPGRANSGAGITHGADAGQNGLQFPILLTDIPDNLRTDICLPILNASKTEANPGPAGVRLPGTTATYTLRVQNTGNGIAYGISLSDHLPAGFTFNSVSSLAYSGGATGPVSVSNLGTATNPEFGTFTLPKDAVVTIVMEVDIALSVPSGTYHNYIQADYTDPTRLLSDPTREITANNYPWAGSNTSYASGFPTGTGVPGLNYDGSPAGPNGEDVVIDIDLGFEPIFLEGEWASNNQAILRWNINSTQAIHQIRIEKSTNIVDFQAISEVVAISNNANYSFSDYDVEEELNAYRILARDIEGNQVYSNVVMLRKESLLASLHPNPCVEGKTKLSLPELGEKSIRIFNSLGQQVQIFTTSEHSYFLDLSIFASDVYTVSIDSESKHEILKVVR